jgi:hypothetical protein
VLPGEVDSHIEPKAAPSEQVGAERWFSTESLILAQDERWRRA